MKIHTQLPEPKDWASDWFARWRAELGNNPLRYGRKAWEDSAICEALFERGLLAPGKRAIGFGVGNEPLPALFARYGVHVLATDAPRSASIDRDWRAHGWHAASVDDLQWDGVCDEETFRSHVTHGAIDMGSAEQLAAIPMIFGKQWGAVDFVWSGNSLDHLGSLDNGIEFVLRACNLLGPGGVFVHTTEFNTELSSVVVEGGDTSFYRGVDICRMADHCKLIGYDIDPVWQIHGEKRRLVSAIAQIDDTKAKAELVAHKRACDAELRRLHQISKEKSGATLALRAPREAYPDQVVFESSDGVIATSVIIIGQRVA